MVPRCVRCSLSEKGARFRSRGTPRRTVGARALEEQECVLSLDSDVPRPPLTLPAMCVPPATSTSMQAGGNHVPGSMDSPPATGRQQHAAVSRRRDRHGRRHQQLSARADTTAMGAPEVLATPASMNPCWPAAQGTADVSGGLVPAGEKACTTGAPAVPAAPAAVRMLVAVKRTAEHSPDR